jgi:hypothetical protein
MRIEWRPVSSRDGARIASVTGPAFVATLANVPALQQRRCEIDDARWARRDEMGIVDAYDRADTALASIRAHCPKRLATISVRCTVLAVLVDKDLRPFHCRLTDFRSRSAGTSQDVMAWVRERWGLDGILTVSLHAPDVYNLAIAAVPASRVAHVEDERVIQP